MYKTSSNLSVSCFRNRLLVWILLNVFCFYSIPSISVAQQPTATISALSGTVLMNDQETGKGKVLSAGDVIETQPGATVVLELSDGSLLELGENTKVNLAELAQTATGARVSLVKLMWGRIRAKLSPGHQQAGSSFNIETPNALVGMKFSQPDVEVSYDPAKQETIGIAHTIELMAKNLLTDEEVLVPVGSTVIIVGTTVKIVAGILAVAGATEAGTAGTGATSAGTSSTGSSGMGTGTKVVLGVGAAAAAGGITALVTSSGDGDDSTGDESDTAESTGELSGQWFFTGSCGAQGCTDDVICDSNCGCGVDFCSCCKVDGWFFVNQTGNTLSGSVVDDIGNSHSLNGTIDGNLVSFTTDPSINVPIRPQDGESNYTGVLDGNTIQGNFSGSGYAAAIGGGWIPFTWSGTFTVTIRKE